ncbi:hypothetical protein LSH36_338g00012 [Paralvinella palmiformis]|uniref:Uncharacterized protein n=1 Tax=Paralvinella palmiformis TaxID=53620 RepID=A0AAD9JG56_9ANNE|nr:hypothetical protein LSH36_338g00012 [Paralvinella palmiformis]
MESSGIDPMSDIGRRFVPLHGSLTWAISQLNAKTGLKIPYGHLRYSEKDPPPGYVCFIGVHNDLDDDSSGEDLSDSHHIMCLMVPLDISEIPKAQHPVKIGLSDAYYYDTSTGSGMKRTIYEYHRVEITADRVFNNSSIIIQPLETCIQQKSCEQCLTANISFKCQYCIDLRRCSDGMDRHRQEWLNHSCHTQDTITVDQCPASAALLPPPAMKARHDINVGAIIAVVITICLLLVITVVLIYGYLTPQSTIGLWLIEHRPSQLRQRLSNVHFFKRNDGGAEKYEVSVQPDGESMA